MHGTFIESTGAPHRQLRQAVLRNLACTSPASFLTSKTTQACQATTALSEILPSLHAVGAATLQCERPLQNDELVTLGQQLGSLLPETAAPIQPYVESGVILNLRSYHRDTTDLHLQPFAANYITLHTECSTRPLSNQPRYLLLACVTPPNPLDGGNTLIVSMDAVHQQLSARHSAALKRIHSARAPAAPSILHNNLGRPTFCFRDPESEAFPWRYEPQDPLLTPADIDEALTALLLAMYDSRALRRIPWQTGLIAIIDNTRFFHGRTALNFQHCHPPRHLQRLRILNAA